MTKLHHALKGHMEKISFYIRSSKKKNLKVNYRLREGHDNYRIHTDPEGSVMKVEKEKKAKGKKEWIELKQLPCE